MLTIPQKYLYHQSQYSKTRDSKYLAMIAQMVRAFGMNPKVGDSSLLQVEPFSVSKTLTLSQEHPFVYRKWMLLPAHSHYFKSLLYFKNTRIRVKVHSKPPMGLLPDMQNCGLRMRQEYRQRFHHHRLHRKPLISDPGMHHGTCVTRDAFRKR